MVMETIIGLLGIAFIATLAFGPLFFIFYKAKHPKPPIPARPTRTHPDDLLGGVSQRGAHVDSSPDDSNYSYQDFDMYTENSEGGGD